MGKPWRTIDERGSAKPVFNALRMEGLVTRFRDLLFF